MRQPKRVTVHPTYGSGMEPSGFVVLVTGRKVQVELHFPNHYNRARAIDETICIWRATMEEVS